LFLGAKESIMADQVILTIEGKAKLEQELEERKEKRKEIIEKIELAKEHGDLSENAEYHEAREDQSFNEGRILEIENILKNASVATQIKGQGVQIGSKISIKFNGDEKIFTIVGSHEADPLMGKISCDSPLGEALINKEVGETVVVKAPKGPIDYQILSIE